jgi:hypothetical protein
VMHRRSFLTTNFINQGPNTCTSYWGLLLAWNISGFGEKVFLKRL